jgi:hypothetical protein
MRNISFALTTDQFMARTKTVTRRLGWAKLKPGDVLMACRKCMGLKPGEKIERLGKIRVVSARREQLRILTDYTEYGFAECLREGFDTGHECGWPSFFVEFFCRSHSGCTPETVVTRIEYEYLEPAGTQRDPLATPP